MGSSGFIGVFDSGVGGISVLKSLAAELPHERFSYFGDSANAPYGDRDAEDMMAPKPSSLPATPPRPLRPQRCVTSILTCLSLEWSPHSSRLFSRFRRAASW